jgi:dimethylhistidine N-methyltransferase
MSKSYKILSQMDLNETVTPNRIFALDVLNGLSETPRRLSSKYFYDNRGSRLFQKIMELPEYYLTRCEFEILENQKEIFSTLLSDSAFNMVELGAGDGVKTSILIDYFLNRNFQFQYVPIDISEAAMKSLIDSMSQKFPGLKANGIVAEYFDALKWLSNITRQRNLVLFLGSNLGNFSKPHSRVFLRGLWNTLNDGDFVLIGFDLKKDIDLMLKAYNDSRGITAEFNLNLLRRINRELGGNFDIASFRFYASYNVFSGAIESYLVSQKEQAVFIKQLGQSFEFEAWEPIHTEYSYKFLESDIEDLAANTGYRIERQLFDSQRYFVDSIWRVEKQEKNNP